MLQIECLLSVLLSVASNNKAFRYFSLFTLHYIHELCALKHDVTIANRASIKRRINELFNAMKIDND